MRTHDVRGVTLAPHISCFLVRSQILSARCSCVANAIGNAGFNFFRSVSLEVDHGRCKLDGRCNTDWRRQGRSIDAGGAPSAGVSPLQWKRQGPIRLSIRSELAQPPGFFRPDRLRPWIPLQARRPMRSSARVARSISIQVTQCSKSRFTVMQYSTVCKMFAASSVRKRRASMLSRRIRSTQRATGDAGGSREMVRSCRNGRKANGKTRAAV